MSIKGTETEKNLLKAFAGESQARNRYYLFAKQARKEGQEVIARIFELTAGNEYIHAEEIFEKLEGGDLEIQATYPAGKIGTIEENLTAAAGGEHEEWSLVYPSFAKTAAAEGFKDISVFFTILAKIEKEHEERYKNVLKAYKAGTLFARDKKTIWKCVNCGNTVESNNPPAKCPICNKAASWFEALEDGFLL